MSALMEAATDFSHYSKVYSHLEKLSQYFGVSKILHRVRGDEGAKNFLFYIS